jgi:hypothetical protein
MTRLDLVKPDCGNGPHYAPKTPAHRLLGLLRLVACASLLCCELSTHVEAYVFLTSPPTVWTNGPIPMDLTFLLLPTVATPLMDGSTSFKSVATNALATWNLYINTVKFTNYTQIPKTPADGDGINQVFFDSTVYGQSFGNGVLAITTTWSIGTTRAEGDTVFNNTLPWNSYRGALQTLPSGAILLDFQRVALHEFGHPLGLGHPDQAGQIVVALMNSMISDLDQLTADDTTGAFFLYGGAPSIVTQPQSQTVTAGASAGFRVIARGMDPLSYQWRFNGTDIPGATTNSYSIARVQSSQAGTYTVVVSNSYGTVQSAPAILAISSATAFGIIGAPFSYQIVANNNPTWYSASGLPSGLSCNGATGLISGTPTRTGVFSVHVEARNYFGTASATIPFTIADGAITSATSAQGVVGSIFNYQIVADNRPTAYSASGLPSGLNCNVGSGIISGTPTQTGTFGVNVQARNLFGSASATISLTISGGAIISPTSAQGVIGVPFSYQIVADNSPTWYTASSLPSGLTCVGGSGLISGIPTQTGTFGVTVQARNLFGSASATISLTISAETIGTASQPTLTISQTGAGFLLTWPATSDGFVLEETQVQPNAWTNSSAQVVTQGNTNAALVPIQSTAKFYRLRK